MSKSTIQSYGKIASLLKQNLVRCCDRVQTAECLVYGNLKAVTAKISFATVSCQSHFARKKHEMSARFTEMSKQKGKMNKQMTFLLTQSIETSTRSTEMSKQMPETRKQIAFLLAGTTEMRKQTGKMRKQMFLLLTELVEENRRSPHMLIHAIQLIRVMLAPNGVPHNLQQHLETLTHKKL